MAVLRPVKMDSLTLDSKWQKHLAPQWPKDDQSPLPVGYVHQVPDDGHVFASDRHSAERQFCRMGGIGYVDGGEPGSPAGQVGRAAGDVQIPCGSRRVIETDLYPPNRFDSTTVRAVAGTTQRKPTSGQSGAQASRDAVRT